MRISALLPCFTALVATHLCSCSTAPRPAIATARPAPLKRKTAGSILHQLSLRRAHFLATGDLRDVFSVFYYHTTAAILQRVESGAISEPQLILEIMETFYGDYDRNRSPNHRELHWQPYYTLAATAQRPDFKTGRDLIERGIEAHIDYDLPRLLATLFQRHPELRGARLERLEGSMRSLNGLFFSCSVLGFQDLATVLPKAPGLRLIRIQSRIACAVISLKRHQAWMRAVRTL